MEKMLRVKKTETALRLATLLAEGGHGTTVSAVPKNHTVFSQGDKADALYYIQSGKLKLSVVSNEGKEAVIALLGARDFFGESCLTAQVLRLSRAVTMSDCSLLRVDKALAQQMLRTQPAFADILLAYMFMRTMKVEEDLVDQLFNSSEKRLARALLLLANFGKDSKPETVIPKISQETLALMIGTTRPRVSFFMNKFRKLGFIKYDRTLEIHSSLLNVILHD